MLDQWYIFRDGQQYGPYTWEEVVIYARSGNIGSADLLWSQSTVEWVRADRVPGLMSAAAAPPAAPSGGKKIAFVAAGSLLVVALAAVSYYFLFTGERETAPSMPPIEIEHPSGARVKAPEGAFFEGTRLEITVHEEMPSAEPFEIVGPAFEVDGLTLNVGGQAVIVDLPAGVTGDRAVVMFYSLGRWVRIPSKEVKLVSGESGRQVQIDGMPFPWRFVVAEMPEKAAGTPDLAEGTTQYALLARLEQLRITDRAAFNAEIGRLEQLESAQPETVVQPGRSFSLVSTAHASEKTPILLTSTSFSDEAYKHFENAQIALYKADHFRLSERESNEMYLAGLKHLENARRAVLKLEYDMQQYPVYEYPFYEEEEDEYSIVYIHGGRMPFIEMIEYYCGSFAPWGLEFMIMLLEADGGWYLNEFDLRVIPYYGQLPFVNMSFPGELVTNVDSFHRRLGANKLKMANDLNMLEGTVDTITVLRIYSPRALEMTTSEMWALAKDAKSAYGAIMGLAKLAKLHPATSVLVTVYVAYKVIKPFVEALFLEPGAKKLEEEGVGTKFISMSIYKAGIAVGNIILDTGKPADDFIDIMMMYMIDYSEIATAEELRFLAADNYGYYNANYSWWRRNQEFQVPPVFIISTIIGNTDDFRPHPNSPNKQPGKQGSYTAGIKGATWMYLAFDDLNNRGDKYDLSTDFHVATEAQIVNKLDAYMKQTGGDWGMLWVDVRKEWLNVFHLDNAPSFQVVLWSIGEETLLHWAEKFDKTSIEDLLDSVNVELHVDVGSIDEYSKCKLQENSNIAGRNDRLRWHQLPDESSDDERVFALAVMEYTNPYLDYWSVENENEEEVGRWCQVPWYFPNIHQGGGIFALSYVIRLLYVDEVLAEYSVHFGNRAIEGSSRLELAGSPYETTPGWVWGTWEAPKDKGRQLTAEIVTVQPPGDCEGTYRGVFTHIDPDLVALGIESLELEFTIVIRPDQTVEMTYKQGYEFDMDLGGGMSLILKWSGEGILTGRCANGQIQLAGKASTVGSQTMPVAPTRPDEHPRIVTYPFEYHEDISFRGQVVNGTIQGVLSGGEGQQAYELEVTAEKVN